MNSLITLQSYIDSVLQQKDNGSEHNIHTIDS